MKRNTVIPRQKSLAVPDIPNPFVHELKLTFLDKVQIALMSVTIAPIRLLLLLFVLTLAWATAAIAISFRSKEDMTKPMSGWRLYLRPVVLFLCRAVFFIGGMFWVAQKGKQASSKEAPILLLAPHSSYLDALATVYLGLTSVVAKSSSSQLVLFGIPFYHYSVGPALLGGYFSGSRFLAKCFVKPVLFLSRTFCRVVGLWVTVKGCGRAASATAPILVVAHHSSLYDAIVFFLESSCLPSPVSRAENAGVCVLKTLTMFSQPVLVDRSDPDSRANTIREIQRRGQSGGQWPQIIIFPEGTCSNRTCLISFKQGAFFPGVPVQPVCVSYPNRLDTVTWTWEGPGAFTQLWLTLCQFYTRVEIEYLPVYTPNEEEKKDAKLFANNVRAVMAAALKVPVTDHTYEDTRLMTKAEKLNLPAEAGLIEFEKIHSKLGMKFDQLQELLINFKDMTKSKGTKKSGEITYEDFSEYLHLPPSEALQQVFDVYDRDGSGTIDFREYIIGLSLVSAPANDESSIELAFQLFDVDNKGYVTRENLHQLLSGAFNIKQEQVDMLFQELDVQGEGKITTDEFKTYAKKKPELASIFKTYRDLKSMEDSGTNGHVSDLDEFHCSTITKRREKARND